MKWTPALVCLLAVLQSPHGPEAAIPYFTNARDVHIADAAKQNYFVVDQEIWNHARSDLADLRLYDGDRPVQYAVTEQREGVASDEVPAKILNLGTVSGHTEFDLDTQRLEQYDRIRLQLDAHDFVATATVSGGSADRRGGKVELPASTLYDFSKEQLGSNSQLKIPPSSFQLLHVKLSAGIRPQDVKGAWISYVREQKAAWTNVGNCAPSQEKQRLTVITCTVPEKVPWSRISLQVAAEQVNFRRMVSVQDPKGIQLASGEISRVRVNREGTLVTKEDLAIRVPDNSSQLTLNIDNGDNPPLKIQSAQPQVEERRIYFDPQGRSSLELYYGDDKLSVPIYDYARFFQVEASAVQAELGAGAHNPRYTARADERPWSERHTGILWAAMLLAILVLAVFAMRGLRSPNPK